MNCRFSKQVFAALKLEKMKVTEVKFPVKKIQGIFLLRRVEQKALMWLQEGSEKNVKVSNRLLYLLSDFLEKWKKTFV